MPALWFVVMGLVVYCLFMMLIVGLVILWFPWLVGIFCGFVDSFVLQGVCVLVGFGV